MIPIKIVPAESLAPFAGRATWRVLIDERYKDDEGLIAHEELHVICGWASLGLYWLLYSLIPQFRYGAEVWCYRMQLKYSLDRYADAALFARFISTRYGLDVSEEQASKDLLE